MLEAEFLGKPDAKLRFCAKFYVHYALCEILRPDIIQSYLHINPRQLIEPVECQKGGCMVAAAYAEKAKTVLPLLRARCETADGGRECRIMDLSHKGVFIESFVPLVSGTEVNLKFRLPNGHMVCTAGVVKYHQFKVGFGLEFTNLSNPDQHQINDWLSQ